MGRSSRICGSASIGTSSKSREQRAKRYAADTCRSSRPYRMRSWCSSGPLLSAPVYGRRLTPTRFHCDPSRRKWTVTGVFHAVNCGWSRSDVGLNELCAVEQPAAEPPRERSVVSASVASLVEPVALSKRAQRTRYPVAGVATPASTAALPNVRVAVCAQREIDQRIHRRSATSSAPGCAARSASR